MKLRKIPDPVLSPYPRKHKPDLKPFVTVSMPKPPVHIEPPEKPAGNKPEMKPEKLPVNASKTPENPTETGNNPEIMPPTQPETPKNKKQALPLKPEPVEPMTVLEDGTVIPPPFKPVDAFTALGSPNPTVAFVMLRQLRDMAGPMPDTSGGALAVIEKLATGLKSGQDLTALTGEISAYIMGDDAANELRLRLHDQHDWERSDQIDKSRSKWEDFCHGCMRRSDLNILEGMALMSYFNDQQKDIFSRMERKRSKGGDSTASRESQELVERVNRPTLIQNKQLQRKFDEASPQEREILRKIGFKMENALAARITKTTETHTVEIIQQNGPAPAV